MPDDTLDQIASALVADGKGILAADESVATLTRRFEALGIQSTEQSRRQSVARFKIRRSRGGADGTRT